MIVALPGFFSYLFISYVCSICDSFVFSSSWCLGRAVGDERANLSAFRTFVRFVLV